MSELVRIGARASRLSQTQTNWAVGLMQVVGLTCTTQWFTTAGDRFLDGRLVDVGGKGLFTKELDEALLRGELDGAVHSMKDLPVVLPDGLVVAAILPRADARDAFVSNTAATLDDLPRGARLGTASLRRTAQAKRARPDLDVQIVRGNVETRLKKLDDGDFDAILLASAGLERLGLAQRITSYCTVDHFVPAAAQGAVCVVSRADDAARFYTVHHAATHLCVVAERAALAVLDGSCRTAIGAYATVQPHGLDLVVELLSDDGANSARHAASCDLDIESATALGRALGQRVRDTARWHVLS